MIVAWKYKEKDIFVQRLDPRARFIFMLAMLFSLIYFWDLRYLAAFFGLALVQYAMAQISFRDARFAWFILAPVLTLMIVFTFLTGRSGTGVYEGHTLITEWEIWFFSIDVTVEKTTFAIAQALRLPAMALFAIVIPYSYNPIHFGPMFRGLGLPDKFAYAMDLAFRLVPTLGRDFLTTYDAQRARGYELERGKGGIVGLIRRIAPLLVPVVIQAVVGGEEVIDAMDLRAFGVGPRTWYTKLEYKPIDKALIGLSVGILVVCTMLSITGYGKFWVPEFMMNLAAG